MQSDNYFSWRELTKTAFSHVSDVTHILRLIEHQMRDLKFDYYALYIRHPVPFTRPKTFFYSSYPQAWIDYYLQQDFAQYDPVLKACHTPGMLWVWREETATDGSRVFEAARKHGIYGGISCSILAKNRSVGILSLAYSDAEKIISLTPELELKIQSVTELAMAALIDRNDISMNAVKLAFSDRELEILKWTAEGKTSAEISLILAISENTVNFHQKNMQKRFNAPNKTQIASYAAAIGII